MSGDDMPPTAAPNILTAFVEELRLRLELYEHVGGRLTPAVVCNLAFELAKESAFR